MIIKARHHWFYYPFFKGYARFMTRLDFRNVHYHAAWDSPGAGNAASDGESGISPVSGEQLFAGDAGQDMTGPAAAARKNIGELDIEPVVNQTVDKRLPVFMIGNHFSWWDGFIALNINQRYFRKKFHIMMLEEQLRDRMFLNKSGAFSLNKGHRSMVETFSYTRELLDDPGNLVVMYPQGKIFSMHDQPYVFEKGWFRIIERLEQPVQLVFYYALVDYFSHRKPTMNIYVYAHDPPYGGADRVEEAFNERFRDALALQRSYLEDGDHARGLTGEKG
jgi:1-acyl-sn-glycerol-3-phosphate acyltransferase